MAITVRNKMGLCPEAFPFDYILSSFQGVIHFLKNDFDNFFPEQLLPFMEDGFKKFAGPHTIFLHHDLEISEVVETFKRRIKRFLNLLAQEKNPVLFVRASGAYFDEAHHIPEFLTVIRERFPALKFRLLFISHYPCEEEKSRPTDPDVMVRYLDTDESWEEDYLRIVGEVIDKNEGVR